MNLQNFIVDIVAFVNEIVIPFILGIAFLIFVFNVFRYFIVGGTNTEGQAKARSVATWSVMAFVFIIIFWGLVNLVTSAFNFNSLTDNTPPCSDYDPNCLGADERYANNVNLLTDLEMQADQAMLQDQRDRQDRAMNLLTDIENEADRSLRADLAEREARRNAILDNASVVAMAFGSEALGRHNDRMNSINTELIDANRNTQNQAFALVPRRISGAVDALIEDAIDETASLTDRATAATIMHLINSETVNEDELLSVYNTFAQEAANTGTSFDAVEIQRQAALNVSDVLAPMYAAVYAELREPLARANRRGLNYWFGNGPNDAAYAAADELIRSISGANQTGPERLAAFDNLIATQEITVPDDLRRDLEDAVLLQQFLEGELPEPGTTSSGTIE